MGPGWDGSGGEGQGRREELREREAGDSRKCDKEKAMGSSVGREEKRGKKKEEGDEDVGVQGGRTKARQGVRRRRNAQEREREGRIGGGQEGSPARGIFFRIQSLWIDMLSHLRRKTQAHG